MAKRKFNFEAVVGFSITVEAETEAEAAAQAISIDVSKWSMDSFDFYDTKGNQVDPNDPDQFDD